MIGSGGNPEPAADTGSRPRSLDTDVVTSVADDGRQHSSQSDEDVAEKGCFDRARSRTSADRRTEPDDEDVDPSALYATNSACDYGPPPDGGFTAWMQVAMAWAMIVCTWGYINSFGAFQAYYVTVFTDRPASDISWIGAVQVWLTFFVSAFSGRMLDAGYFKITFITGAVFHLLGVFLMSVSGDVYWKLMLTQGVLTGLGNGIFFTPAMALVATYFDKKRALAVGLVTTGNSVGGLVYPAIVRGVLPKLGFAWTARVVGFMNLCALLLAAVFMKPRLPPRKAGPVIEFAAFKEPIYLSYVAGLFMLTWATYYTLYYIASFALQAIGMPYTEAAILVTIVNGVGLPARILVPMLALKIGPLNCAVMMTLAATIVAFGWLGVTDKIGIYIFTAFYGIASAGFQCLMPTGIASITTKLNKVGTRLGMAFTVASFAGLTGPPLGGAIEDSPGGYQGAHAWAAAVTLLGTILMVTSRLFKTGLVVKKSC